MKGTTKDGMRWMKPSAMESLVNLSSRTLRDFEIIHTENIRLILTEAKKQITNEMRIRTIQIRESVEQIKDLYIRLDWRFRSWLPFVSSFCPYDTIQIWKKGVDAATRMRIN